MTAVVKREPLFGLLPPEDDVEMTPVEFKTLIDTQHQHWLDEKHQENKDDLIKLFDFIGSQAPVVNKAEQPYYPPSPPKTAIDTKWNPESTHRNNIALQKVVLDKKDREEWQRTTNELKSIVKARWVEYGVGAVSLVGQHGFTYFFAPDFKRECFALVIGKLSDKHDGVDDLYHITGVLYHPYFDGDELPGFINPKTGYVNNVRRIAQFIWLHHQMIQYSKQSEISRVLYGIRETDSPLLPIHDLIDLVWKYACELFYYGPL